jgi:hypothetical protein
MISHPPVTPLSQESAGISTERPKGISGEGLRKDLSASYGVDDGAYKPIGTLKTGQKPTIDRENAQDLFNHMFPT